jgi:hypothetical protein
VYDVASHKSQASASFPAHKRLQRSLSENRSQLKDQVPSRTNFEPQMAESVCQPDLVMSPPKPRRHSVSSALSQSSATTIQTTEDEDGSEEFLSFTSSSQEASSEEV